MWGVGKMGYLLDTRCAIMGNGIRRGGGVCTVDKYEEKWQRDWRCEIARYTLNFVGVTLRYASKVPAYSATRTS